MVTNSTEYADFGGISLEDSYEKSQGRVHLTGMQALVRLPFIQKREDEKDGLNTAGYITGYRGSPLGGYDIEILRQAKRLKTNNIVFQPGINEDLAATAVWGTQRANAGNAGLYDGVFALWYGKGPGVDRSGDPFKHGTRNGTAPNGGVLLVFGDDHAGKSSTTAHQSDTMLAANGIPVLYPSTIGEVIEFGLFGWALSRYSGLWVGLKCVNETAEATASVHLKSRYGPYAIPEDVDIPESGLNVQSVFNPLGEEALHFKYKIPAALAFARCNRIDRVAMDGPRRELGIVATGKAYLDLMDALDLLGIDAVRAQEFGLRVYKPGLIWPLEPDGLKDFAYGHKELLFVEEKAPLVENQASALLYNLPSDKRPTVIGKHLPDGSPCVPDYGVLDPLKIALIVSARLRALKIGDASLNETLVLLNGRSQALETAKSSQLVRRPWYCSGCPHNTSTTVPEGSSALSGIGCHTMAAWMDRDTELPVQMGGEGANWIGMSPFIRTRHIFQNLGDGTFNHSGLLAIRAAVAAGVNITYKILYNDAVAMTGGQKNDGDLTVRDILRQVLAENVSRVVLVTNDVTKDAVANLPNGVHLYPREELDQVQKELRQVPGVTVLVYDQICAAELRRRRKRGLAETPNKRAFINELVCEGCGDCSTQSNCVSILPNETEFGTKRRIDQSSCNLDFSCIKGFCPAFVTIEGATAKKAARPKGLELPLDNIAEPQHRDRQAVTNILISGIGGTGIVTVGSILGMAAHLEDKEFATYNMTGLAQKGGAVYSHVRISSAHKSELSSRIAPGEADLLLGCDLSATASGDALESISSEKTQVVLNEQATPPGSFQIEKRTNTTEADYIQTIRNLAGEQATRVIGAANAAKIILGDSVGVNVVMLGIAYQLGHLPVSARAIERAIELNGASAASNIRAFRLGRLMIEAPDALAQITDESGGTATRGRVLDLHELIEHRAAFLTSYQDSAYADRYRALVELAKHIDQRIHGQYGSLTEAVARFFFKLMAYKDEYEVARLYTNGAFEQQLKSEFDGPIRLTFHLAPPLLASDPNGDPIPAKREFGPWVFSLFRILARLRRLRGTPFDVFGYTQERRRERALISEYEAQIQRIAEDIGESNYAVAVEIASYPDMIRGFGHIKEANISSAEKRIASLFNAFHGRQTVKPEAHAGLQARDARQVAMTSST